ncbi:MAG: hypothetical protein H6609_15850 [Ignavibacteriales bacterium]|nr:hypothetical protein [Ignavibacteriales bacterium]
MPFNKNAILIYILIFSITACFDKPDEFVSPSWDTEINIPLTAKEFKLLELVEKDSSLLKSSQDPSTLGLIYFGDTQAVSTIRITNELKINAIETEFSQTIGPLKINTPIPAASEIRVEDWTTEVTSGSYQVFPEQEGDVDIEVIGIETVESLFADEGILNVTVYNNLPVEIELRGMHIQNSIDQSLIADLPASNPIDWISIQPLSFETVEFNIDGKVVTNSLQYIGTIWSQGSNGDSVQIPIEAGTTVLALFDQLVIGAATASLPVQNFQFSKSVVLDDSTKIEEALINEGKAELIANNNMDVNLRAIINFDNLLDDNGKQYNLEVPLLRNEKNKIIELPSLTDWVIKTSTPGIPTSEVSYTVDVLTDSTGEISTISKEDSVNFDLKFDELVFETFNGILKPTRIDIKESGFNLDYGSFNEQFEYSDINFKDAIFLLNFNTSADLNVLYDGTLSATNGIEYRSQNVSGIYIPSDQRNQVEISDLINSFSQELPDSFSMTGQAILNPKYEYGSFTRGDSIFGEIDFQIPLNVGIAEGSFKDTLEVDLGDVSQDEIDKLNYGEVTFTVKNTVPVILSFTADVLDSNYHEILKIPTLYNQIENIQIPAPVMSDIGEVLTVGEVIQTIELQGDDIKKILENPYIKIEVLFNTANVEQGPVKFKTSNKISFDVRAKAEYRVDFD